MLRDVVNDKLRSADLIVFECDVDGRLADALTTEALRSNLEEQRVVVDAVFSEQHLDALRVKR